MMPVSTKLTLFVLVLPVGVLLVAEAKDLLEKTTRQEKSVFEKLEDFIKSDNLGLEVQKNPLR